MKTYKWKPGTFDEGVWLGMALGCMITIMVMFLCGYTESTTKDPRCLDGYLVYALDHQQFNGFCTDVVIMAAGGIYAKGCYDTPNAGSRVEMRMVLREATFVATECYNVLAREK